jgi:hypothetical protein
MATLDLQEFDMRRISFDPTKSQGPIIVLIGRRDTGKSFLVRDLLYNHQDIPVGTVISGTEAGNGFYSDIVPKLFIHDTFDVSLITKSLARQETMINLQKTTKPNLDPRAFIILDDCLCDNKWTKETAIRTVFMNGRHWKLLLIITMQYPLGMPPILRTNIDYVFILREPYISNRKKIYEHYAGMFPNFDSFSQVMNQCTENYECLVIDNNSKHNDLCKQVFWYRAKDRPDFKLGSKQLWEMSKNLPAKKIGQQFDPLHTKPQQVNVKKTKSAW